MTAFDQDIQATREWFASPRFAGITRLHTARQVVEQRGTIPTDYTVARETAAAFHDRLRELFAQGKGITTFGPYSPGQGVVIKRLGIEGIYLGGWATSAKGSATEDPGPDLASYPLSQVPDEAAGLVRALLTADRNQQFLRSRMTPAQQAASPAVDFRPFIIADADTGHGGDPHVRNLVRRFVEVGVPGYHIEDQRPGTKKCGHQGGKVLVSSNEQIKRLNAARFQLDVMRVPGLIVARTDAESANLLESRGDERDQPFILGVTNLAVPSYKVSYLALIRRFHQAGVDELNGHLLYAIADDEYRAADSWLDRTGLGAAIAEAAAGILAGGDASIDDIFERVAERFLTAWEDEAGLATYADAVADHLRQREAESEGAASGLGAESWLAFARGASLATAGERARSLGLDVSWDCELATTPEGYYQVQGGIPYAIAKSLAVAPFADLLWMETKTADLEDARRFADAIHAAYPDQMLAYNLSPSFNWDSTGMSDDDMRRFPEELGKMGFVFNFITYGGHQVDGVAAEEFATALKQDGMLALARLQRKIRLVESPYRTPQTLVGGPAPRCRAAGLVRPHGDDDGDGQGLHPAPAHDPDRGTQEAARGVAGGVGHPQRRDRADPRAAAAASGGLGAAGAGPRGRPRHEGGCPGLRPHPRPPGAQHPVGTGPEHLRRVAPPQAPDDADPPVPDPPLPRGLGALREPDGGQPGPDGADAGAGHLR